MVVSRIATKSPCKAECKESNGLKDSDGHEDSESESLMAVRTS